MSKSKKHERKSATPSPIIVGSIVFSIGMANPVPFIVAVLFVWIFSNRF